MTPTYLAAVPWDSQRADNARSLQRQITGQGSACTITWDIRRDAYDTFTRNVEAANGGPGIFIEDDIELTTGWGEKAQAVIDTYPGHLIQFYSNRKADTEVGSRWEPGRSFMNNQCWYAPAGMTDALAAWLHEWPGRANDPTGYDLAMAQFLSANGLRYRLHVPSLVQHQGALSVINAKRPRRQSRTFQP